MICSKAILIGQFLDTTIVIEKIEIKGKSPSSVSLIDSTNVRATSLVNALSNNTNFFIKNYGPSSIGTMSYRGGNASQTEVLWNGAPINNPMLGLNDLSLLNTFLFDDVKLVTNEKGINGLTSALNIETHNSAYNQLFIHNSIGSFGSFNHGLKVDVSKNKFNGKLSVLSTRATNDFTYKLSNGIQEKTLNAGFKQNAVLGTLGYRINNYLSINTNVWWQESYRELPKLTTQNKSLANQTDESIRSQFSINYQKPNLVVNFMTSYHNEALNYIDPQIGLNSESKFNLLYAILEFQQSNKFGFTKFSTNLQNSIGNIYAYQKEQSLTLSKSLISHAFHLKSIELLLGGGFITNQQVKLNGLFQTKMKYIFNRNYSAHAEFKNAYRYPTLNDLFWVNGGNSNLIPENSINTELGFNYLGTAFQYNIVGYRRITNDWILWALVDNATLFKAYNIAKVASQGVELNFSYSSNLGGKFNLLSKVNGYISKSINLEEIQIPKISKGDQLLYTPTHQFSITERVTFNRSFFEIEWNKTSSTKGINKLLPSFHLLNARLNHTFLWKRTQVKAQLSINNILNQNYKVVENRPMPGINYQLNFQIIIF